MIDEAFDEAFRADGISFLCGVDEAGRGPLAGPVCAAAVVLPGGVSLEDLNDSKQLSEKQRDRLFPVICKTAIAYHVAFADVEEIERLNILGATMLAMRRAVEGLSPCPQLILVDGNRLPSSLPAPARAVVRGDAISQSIAAASVLAKVSRDAVMTELDRLYPAYGFASHKGYGTRAHREAILRYGPLPCHRRSFLKKLFSSAER